MTATHATPIPSQISSFSRTQCSWWTLDRFRIFWTIELAGKFIETWCVSAAFPVQLPLKYHGYYHGIYDIMNVFVTYCIGIQDLSPWMRSGLLVRSLQRTGDFGKLSKDARCSMASPFVDHFPWGNRGFSHAFPHESIGFDGETSTGKHRRLLGSWVVTSLVNSAGRSRSLHWHDWWF